jgi:hypothetical protein
MKLSGFQIDFNTTKFQYFIHKGNIRRMFPFLISETLPSPSILRLATARWVCVTENSDDCGKRDRECYQYFAMFSRCFLSFFWYLCNKINWFSVNFWWKEEVSWLPRVLNFERSVHFSCSCSHVYLIVQTLMHETPVRAPLWSFCCKFKYKRENKRSCIEIKMELELN